MRQCATCGERYEGSHQCERSYPGGYPTCQWESGSGRCRYPGTISPAGNGPWYCRHHYECDSPSFGDQVVVASRDYVHASSAQRTAELTELAYRVTGGKRSAIKANKAGNLDWAKKILRRVAAGESLPYISEKFAKEALGLK